MSAVSQFNFGSATVNGFRAEEPLGGLIGGLGYQREVFEEEDDVANERNG